MNFARYALGLAVCGVLLASCSSEEPAPPPKKEKVVKEKKAKPAPVEEEDPVLQPMTAAPEPAAAPAGNSSAMQQESGSYVVQIGIQPSRKAANALIEKLATAGITAYAAEVEDPGELEGTYYRVRAGYFATIRDAQAFGKEVVEPAGFPWWVDNKANDKVGNPSDEDSYEATTSYSSPSSYSSYSEPVRTYEPEPEPAPAPAPAPTLEPVAAPEPEPVAEEPPPALPEEAAAPGGLPPMEDVEGPIAEEPSIPAPAAPELDDDSWD